MFFLNIFFLFIPLQTVFASLYRQTSFVLLSPSHFNIDNKRVCRILYSNQDTLLIHSVISLVYLLQSKCFLYWVVDGTFNLFLILHNVCRVHGR
jgi:uncharacterized membrane protein SirB2